MNGTEGPETAARLVKWLQTGDDPGDLFAPNAFGDLTLPHWRLQADNRADLIRIRTNGHAGPSDITVERLEPTPRGWVMQVEERWIDEQGQSWYCREMFLADVADGMIQEISIFCAGDWDEAAVQRHAAEVKLIRP